MDYQPNRQAVAWLTSDVLPLLSDARLRVVGAGAVPAHPRVEAAGFVPDVTTEWRRAAALVVPLRAGGGTRLKVLEALAHGLPVVSTAVGVEGLGAVAGEHYLAAETAGDFAEHVASLRDDDALRDRLSERGRELAEGFSWDACLRPLVELVTVR
jgi:glycosyltransferase involved in cell wall biosynthesis